MFDERKLRLVILHWEGDEELWSLEHEKMLCMADDSTLSGGWAETTPRIYVGTTLEAQVNAHFGRGFVGADPPSHIEVLRYIKDIKLVPENEGLGKGYAGITWHIGDVTGEYELTDEQAHDFLARNEKYIRDVLVQWGNESVIHTLLGDDGIPQRKDEDDDY